LIKLSACLFPE